MKRKEFLKLTSGWMAGTFFLSSCAGSGTSSAGKGIISASEKIGFFGDSITFGGGYIDGLRKMIHAQPGLSKVQLYNYGKSSETVSGLSEEIHDPRRPHLFSRLKETYDEDRASLLFFCYGINDGIYHPYSEEKFNAYRQGVQEFLSFATRVDVPVILLSAPPFAISEVKQAELRKKEVHSYSWKDPHPEYNEVMKRYKDYIMSIRHDKVVRNIDIYSPLYEARHQAYGSDPIHPNATGHQIIAETIANEIFA